jgi:hypothetical protein
MRRKGTGGRNSVEEGRTDRKGKGMERKRKLSREKKKNTG